jgi:ufm1-conjugating enzyme 1
MADFVIEATEGGEAAPAGEGGEDAVAHAEFGDKHSSLCKKLPLLTVNAGPRNAKAWQARLKQEYVAIIKLVKMNKANDEDWFSIQSNKIGTRWKGKCWIFLDALKYEFKMEFEIPVSYPATSPELCLPDLDGKTDKMYRGGKICLTDHFNPLWARNAPGFGIAHALVLGLATWMAVEIPDLIARGVVAHVDGATVIN